MVRIVVMEDTKTNSVETSKVANTENVTVVAPTQILGKKPLSLAKQISYVKKHFKTDGYLLTLEVKRITDTQASLHGMLYKLGGRKGGAIAAEGLLVYPISDQNFKDSQFVVAFNLGYDSLSNKIETFFKENTDVAFSNVVNVLTSIGFRLFGS